MKSLNFDIKSDYAQFKECFLAQNSLLNLISKNEEKFLYEKHFYDSLAIKLFFEKNDLIPDRLLDIGTGGGFPSVPIALEYPQIQVTAIDSIRKKINAVNQIKDSLGLENLQTICNRVENITDKKYSVVVSRAVAKINVLASYLPNVLSDNGYFIAYKSKLASEEIDEAKTILKRNNLKYLYSISYDLPLDEKYERKLIVIQKTI